MTAGLFILSFSQVRPSFLVQADTVVDNQNATANVFFNVTAPSANTWSITAGNFSFADQIISGGQVSVNSASDNPIVVTNLSGTNTAFSIQQRISDFTLSTNSTVLPVTAFNVTVGSSTDGKLVGAAAINIFKQNGEVLRSGNGANGKMTSGNVSAQLLVDGSTKAIAAGTYSATITSTIVAGP
ncbi:hypothetical protein JW886_06415 [Lactococcus taiwanensis]|uniref:WxL domain-containing protein n=1 Tax=Lactococcus taiwanensis TaxID=1151742 RepID=A0AA45QSA5_9LACT|nr:hypothetical protein JW886_06415 [Lactococcus taiwanensis]